MEKKEIEEYRAVFYNILFRIFSNTTVKVQNLIIDIVEDLKEEIETRDFSEETLIFLEDDMEKEVADRTIKFLKDIRDILYDIDKND